MTISRPSLGTKHEAERVLLLLLLLLQCVGRVSCQLLRATYLLESFLCEGSFFPTRFLNYPLKFFLADSFFVVVPSFDVSI